MEKITSETFKEIYAEELKQVGEIPNIKDSQALAWDVIFSFCLQNGMKTFMTGRSGIEDVLYFIENLITKNETNNTSKTSD